MAKRFESKRDLWLQLLAWGAALVCIIVLSPLLIANVAGTLKLLIGGLLALSVGLIGWVNLGTYYVVDDATLSIRCGPFHWRVPIDAIQRVVPTRAAWSSPALSLDRLRIEYGDGKWIMVSPALREEFVRSLRVIEQ